MAEKSQLNGSPLKIGHKLDDINGSGAIDFGLQSDLVNPTTVVSSKSCPDLESSGLSGHRVQIKPFTISINVTKGQ